MRLKARRPKVKLTDTYMFTLVPFGALLSRVSNLTLGERTVGIFENGEGGRGQITGQAPGGPVPISHLIWREDWSHL